MTARAVPEISPENLLRIISTRQNVGSVREGVDALERLAMDLDRYGFVVVAESIAYIVKQMDACVEADAETVREALDAAEKSDAMVEQLESEADDDVATLREELAECREDIVGLEAELRKTRAALDAALAGAA